MANGKTNEDSYITSKNDLMEILSGCNRCFNSTLKGALVISHKQLPHISLNYLSKLKNLCLIIHSGTNNETAHWFNLVIYNRKTVLLCDGLNQIKTNQEIMSNIASFCRTNRLVFHDFKLRYQTKTSKKCGYLACFFAYKLTSSTFHNFLKFQRMLVQNSVATNEQFMMQRVISHFNLLI